MKHGILAVAFLLPLIATAQQPMTKGELTQFVAQRSQQIALDWRESNIQHAVAILESIYALPNIRELDGVWTGALYNLACGYSLLGNKEESLSILSDAIQSGFSDYDQITRDGNLDRIRADDRFASIVKPLKLSAESIHCPWIPENTISPPARHAARQARHKDGACPRPHDL